MTDSLEENATAESRITSWLRRSSVLAFSLYAVAASFCTYFCMYGFRKAFAAARYEGLHVDFLGLDLKAALVISQVMGYALSKFIGIKFLSELSPARRAWVLVGAIVLAQAALVLLAVLPVEAKIIGIFLNGLPLGIVWGLVYSYLEGRTTSEILGAGLSCSFIVASGVAKAVGDWLMTSFGVTEEWMPAAAGCLYLPPFLLSVWFLDKIPPPTGEDVEQRVRRERMNARQRLGFLSGFAGGLFLLLLLYCFLTAYRDYRDNFFADVLSEMNIAYASADFARTEVRVALPVFGALALLYLIKDNRRAFFYTHLMMLSGTVLVGVSTLLRDQGRIGGILWITLVGLGLYMAYVPFGCILFDRLIAAMRTVATAVFAIYVADALGYVGSISVVLYDAVGNTDVPKLEFFRNFSYFTSILCSACYVGSWIYFWRKRPAGA